LVVITLALVSACAHNELLTATAQFSATAKTSVSDLGAGPRLVLALCRQSAELRYVQNLGAMPRDISFSAWYEQPTQAAPGVPSVTPRQICAAYRLADAGFEDGLASIAAYAEALGVIANGGTAPTLDLNGLASSVAARAATLSGAAAAYKPALEGAGKPLSEIASALLASWEASKLREIVGKTDQPFHNLIGQLLAFLDVVKRGQLREVRLNLAEEVKAHRVPGAPPNVALAYTIAFIDVEMTRRLDRIELQIAALTDLLNGLARAHKVLKDGWERGDSSSIDTVRALASMAKDIYTSAKGFQNPQPGGQP
jgi:hypothetical protein